MKKVFKYAPVIGTLILICSFASCKDEPGINKNISEDELTAVLKKDAKFIEYCTAMKELKTATVQIGNIEGLSQIMRAAISNKEIENIDEFKKKYVANGGDSVFLNAFNNVYLAQQDLKERYKIVIEHDPDKFQRSVRKGCFVN